MIRGNWISSYLLFISFYLSLTVIYLTCNLVTFVDLALFKSSF